MVNASHRRWSWRSWVHHSWMWRGNRVFKAIHWRRRQSWGLEVWTWRRWGDSIVIHNTQACVEGDNVLYFVVFTPPPSLLVLSAVFINCGRGLTHMRNSQQSKVINLQTGMYRDIVHTNSTISICKLSPDMTNRPLTKGCCTVVCECVCACFVYTSVCVACHFW